MCECVDRKIKKTWGCGQTWTEDCFDKVCTNQKIELTPVSCPETGIPICPRQQATKVLEGCCETWKCDCKFPKCCSVSSTLYFLLRWGTVALKNPRVYLHWHISPLKCSCIKLLWPKFLPQHVNELIIHSHEQRNKTNS